MQIAKLFASLGFKIDTSDLSQFDAILKNTQAEMSQFARDCHQANLKLKTMKGRFKEASDSMKSSNVAKAADRVAKAVDKYVKNVKEIIDIDPKIDKIFIETGNRFTTLSNKIDGGTAAWNRYEQQVKEATQRMREFTAAAKDRQSVNPPRNTGAGSGSNQGGGNAGGRGNNGRNDGGGGTTAFLGARQFGKAFVGQMAFGGALGAGYLIKEVVQSGREVQKMEQMLLQASKSAQDFQNNLSFTKDTSNALAVDFTEFGVAYSKILNATERSILTQKQKEDIVYGFAKYMRTINLARPDQAGVFRQLGQMFNTGRIQQDEINSMSDRGIAMNKFLRMAAEKLGMSSDDYTKMQEAGKADPIKLMPIVSKMLADAADNNGAFSKSLTTSLAKQQAFTNAMKEFAATVLKSGLDKALGSMFSMLEKVVLILTPMVVGLIEAFKGLFYILDLLVSIPLEVWAVVAANALAALFLMLALGGKSALFAAGAFTVMGTALRFLKAALPIAAMMGLLWVMGEFTKWKKEQESGVQTYTWIDLWIERMTFFFLYMKLGWLNTDIAIAKASLAIKDFFTIEPPDWWKNMMQKRAENPEFKRQQDEMQRQLNNPKVIGQLSPNQNLSIPVDVYLTIQNPDGSTYMARASQTPIINVGALGLTVG